MTQVSSFTAALDKVRKHIGIVIVVILIAVVLLSIMSIIASRETNKIKNTMDDAAYGNMENTLQNLGDMISNTLALDREYLQTLASAACGEADKQKWIDSLDLGGRSLQNIFYADGDQDIAIGKNGEELDISEHTFTEHSSGQVRSEPFMTSYGTYSYLMREPVGAGAEFKGYLYGQYSMSRLKNILPQNVANGNDVSLMEASTLKYVYVPSTSASSVHINYRNLKYYLEDPSEAPAIVDEIEKAISEKQYYMRILSFAYSKGHSKTGTDYVVFLWPVDDGEYYISGFSDLDYMQSERFNVETTLDMMISMLLGICMVVVVLLGLFFGNMAVSNRRKAVLQKKHNEELVDALQIAKIANESKSNFLSNMSHDIRTPMNAIIGYTTLMSREADDPDKIREYTEKIAGAGDYLLGLINDVLDMSKIESGKTTLNIIQFNIRTLVNEIESIIRMQAEEEDQTFTVDIHNVEKEEVMGDQLRIRQIILNLLSNALKYTPPGGAIRFAVEGELHARSNIQSIRIIVQDTGYGMDADYIKTIFDPFTRLDNNMTGKIQGTGLGLAITKNIVDLMGGTIDVKSELNKGSSFTVELELPVSDKNPVEKRVGSSIADDNSISLEGLRILAAEDNELNAEILVELLHVEGAECDVCEDGRKIVDRFEQSAPGAYDLILMDIQMPYMNGYEATKAIRAGAHPDAKSIPIVAMTANAFAEDVIDSLNAGMNAHIAKPVNMAVLKKTLNRVINGRLKNDSE